MDTEVIAQEPCLIAIVSWLQENALGYFDEEEQFQTEEEDESCQPGCKLTRYWIYSHHIYSKVDFIFNRKTHFIKFFSDEEEEHPRLSF